MARPTKAQTFMAIAETWAKRATCSARVQVGAVLVDTHDRVVASGYNGSPRNLPHCDDVGCLKDGHGHCLRVVHAEANAILQCAASGANSDGTTLYVTHWPCTRCAVLIIQAGIKKVIWKEPYGSGNEVVISQRLFDEAGVEVKHYEG